MRRKTADKTTLEADTVGYMPERFIAGYFELVRLGLKTAPSAQQFDNESGSVKKKYRTPDGGLKDEQALRFKAWVDRQLRAIGRDMQAYLNARDSTGPSPIGMSPSMRREIARELERKTELKCTRCGKYISWQWSCCAWCGHRLVEERNVNASTISEHGQGRDNDGQVGGTSEPPLTAGPFIDSPCGARDDSHPEDGGEAGRHVEDEGGNDQDS